MLNTKRAATDGNDVPFEQAFSSIAHSYIQDVAPKLLAHELGFQLLERSEDNYRVSGVLGFKVGSQILNAPVFFLGGKLKGNELLYLTNEDLFVPLNEKWVMRLLNQKPLIIGEGIKRTNVARGVRWPNLDQLRRPPPKYASVQAPAVPDWVASYLPVYAAAKVRGQEMLNDPRYDCCSLPALLKNASARVVTKLLRTAEAYPWFTEHLTAFYGDKVLDQIVSNVKRAAAPTQVASRPGLFDEHHPIKNGSVQFLTFSNIRASVVPMELDESEQEELAREGVVIRDKRDDKDPEAQISRAYNVAKSLNIFNPTESGIYDVLLAGGRFSKCLVIVQPRNGTHVAHAVLVISLSAPREWFAASGSRVWVVKKYPDKDWTEWYDGLPGLDTLQDRGSEYIVLNQAGQATQPFRVRDSVIADDDRKSIRIEFAYTSRCDLETAYAPNGDNAAPQLVTGDAEWSSDSTWLVIRPESFGQRFAHSGDGLVVPNNFKVVRVSRGYADEDGDEEEPDEDGYRFEPGNGADVNHLLMSKLARLKVWTDCREFSLNNQRMTKPAALISLVRDYGLLAADARGILKEAEAATRDSRQGGTCRYMLKLAAPWENQDEGPNAPEFPEQMRYSSSPFEGARADVVRSEQQLVPATEAQHGDNRDQYRSEPLDPETMREIDNAAQTGQRELFDTAVLKGLAANTNIDREIESCIDGLVPGLDRLGRMLFLLYSHGDQFAERYGKTDLQELEDGLQSAFEKTGEIVLFLETREIEGNPQAARLRFNLDQ